MHISLYTVTNGILKGVLFSLAQTQLTQFSRSPCAPHIQECWNCRESFPTEMTFISDYSPAPNSHLVLTATAGRKHNHESTIILLFASLSEIITDWFKCVGWLVFCPLVAKSNNYNSYRTKTSGPLITSELHRHDICCQPGIMQITLGWNS